MKRGLRNKGVYLKSECVYYPIIFHVKEVRRGPMRIAEGGNNNFFPRNPSEMMILLPSFLLLG